MALNHGKLIATVERLVGLLAAGGYGEMARLTDSVRLRSEEIEHAASRYPGEIIATVTRDGLDVVEIETRDEQRWSVNVRLHTNMESPSDLTMSLTLTQSDSEYYDAEIDDIHVL